MELEVLVSTMNQKDIKLLNKMNIQSDAIIINQCETNSSEEILMGNYNVKWKNSTSRGLSISRNKAIEVAEKDICVLADDDLVYTNNYKEVILEQFELYPDVDIITFQVEGIEKAFKKYHKYSRKLNYLKSMKVSSVEVAFRLSSIKENDISFNEIFGSGAKYLCGEENIFLFDCLRSGLKIQYVPIKIADLHIGDSSWFKGYNKEYFVTRGANFTAMSKGLSIFLIFQFAVRKYKLYHKQMPFLLAVRWMMLGRKQFRSV